jgi:hypothetical protein
MYNEYTEDELIEVYSTMIDYSGKADPKVLEEIEKRGGLNSFLDKIKQREINKEESNRVLNELIKLNREGFGLDEIKKTITSEIWTKQHLNAFIENRYIRHQLFVSDKTIDRDIILKSIFGILLASVVGSMLWAFSMIFLKAVLYPILIGIYFISYLIIRGLVGKSHNNGMVLFAGVTATIISFIVGFYIVGKM